MPDALDVELAGPSRPQFSSGPAMGAGAALADHPGGPLPELAEADAASGQAPAPAQPERPRIQLDQADVALLADFGPTPAGWLGAPAYTIRVFNRKRQLKPLLARARENLTATYLDELGVLTRFVERIRETLPAEHAARPLFAPLSAADDVARAKGAALEQTAQRASEDVAQAERAIGEKEAEARKLEETMRSARITLETRNADKTRGEAKLKRVEIELRAAHEAARIAAGPNAKFAPPEHAAKIQTLDTEKSAREAELRPILAAYNEAAAHYQRLEGEARAIRRKIQDLRSTRDNVQQRGAHGVSLRSQSAREADEARLRAYAAVARTLFTHHADLTSPSDRADAEDAAARVKSAEHSVALHEAALASGDRQAQQRGLILAGVAVLLLIGLILSLRLS